MKSYEGYLCKLKKLPQKDNIELVGNRKIKVGDEGIILTQYPNKTFYVEMIDSEGKSIAYCYLGKNQIEIKMKPKVKQQK